MHPGTPTTDQPIVRRVNGISWFYSPEWLPCRLCNKSRAGWRRFDVLFGTMRRYCYECFEDFCVLEAMTS